MNNNGHWIKIERLNRQISQAKLAKILEIDQVILSEWETGKKFLSEESRLSIERIFSKVDELSEMERGKLFQRREYRQNRYDVSSKNNDHFKEMEEKQFLSKPEFLREQYTQRIKTSKPKGIALFAGCGGLSFGFHRAGFDIVGFAELRHEFHSTYKKNFPDALLLGDDVRNISNKDVGRWGKIFGEIDVLFGGPPCQGYSLAGKRDVFDPRNQLYKEFVRIASVLKPKTILLENVRLLTSMKTTENVFVAKDIVKRFEKIGYNMSYEIVNAKDFGVPQSRERVIFIGVRKDSNDRSIRFPEPTHGPQNNSLLFQLKPYSTFREATHDLESLESGEKSLKDPLHFAIAHPNHVLEWLKNVPEGESAHKNSDPKLRPKSGYNTTYKRIRWDEPCSTISTNFSMISGSRNVHPSNTRSLTIREAARCQTFPDNFCWDGKWGIIRTMIGNAVPPTLAEVIATHILKNYLQLECEKLSKQRGSEVYKSIQLQD